jgi:hypothetical protein
MIAAGFKPYRREWWHFELVDEPFHTRVSISPSRAAQEGLNPHTQSCARRAGNAVIQPSRLPPIHPMRSSHGSSALDQPVKKPGIIDAEETSATSRRS